MQRIIAYIYRYKGEGNIYRKCGNVGFCRVEEIGGKRIINMCFKETYDITRECEISELFLCNSDENNICKCGYGKKIRNDEISGGQMRLRIQGEKEDGLCISSGSERYIVLWNGDRDVILFEEDMESQKTQIQNIEEQKVEVQKMQPQKVESNFEAGQEVEKKEFKESKSENEQLQRAYNRMAKVPMVIDDAMCQVVKMKPQQMIMLPRRYWRLTNNRFLMDCVYVHKHILFFKHQGHYIIGVPSVYADNEKDYASKLGFEGTLNAYDYGKPNTKNVYWIMPLS